MQPGSRALAAAAYNLSGKPSLWLSAFASGRFRRPAHLSRRAVLIDLNPDYIDQQLKRNQAMPLGLEAA